ncbi:hypothetical protein ABG79_00525 [Caloramator mitchellensis]|uniref:DUF1659 domain-containing protein n=1 Tax=Caloramator mitchellensis TaxID=908809 RepID=A0A0R3JVY3_CALMK|nr:DUF1659 domain-containing protein [Caloramator mitchellensis]KRQ87723.1 hypothetical protein ABG79_00525 [Caloramator mitchellensis]
MAVSALQLTSNVVLRVKIGVDQNGSDIERAITLRKVKANATNDDVFAITQALAGILEGPLNNVIRQDFAELVNL